MKTKIITIDDFNKESKKRQRKEQFKNKVKNAVQWCVDNKEILIIVVPVIGAGVTGLTKVGKGISRNIALKQEKRLKESFIYDRSLGKYLELRKPLKQSQMKTILERKDSGEKLANILDSMNLLK